MRLIDADSLKTIICLCICGPARTQPCPCGCAQILAVDNAPTIEAAPIRRGHWVKVSGYITPGGDPLWKCSECGKGLHLYGVEHGSYGSDVADSQWVACPNCGAVMSEASG